MQIKKTRIFKLATVAVVLGSLVFASLSTVAAPNPNFKIEVNAPQNTKWYSNINIRFTNVSSQPQSIANAIIHFRAPYSSLGFVSGTFPIYPEFSVRVQNIGNEYDYAVTLKHPSWQSDSAFKNAEVIKPQQSFMLNFGGTGLFNDTQAAYVSIETSGGQTPKNDGALVINDGEQPQGWQGIYYPSVVINSKTNPATPRTLHFNAWNQSIRVNQLEEPGGYDIEPQPLTDGSGELFKATGIYNVSLDSAQPVSETLTFVHQLQRNAAIQFNLPVKPDAQLPDSISATLEDLGPQVDFDHREQPIKLAWGRTTRVNKLLANEQYTLQLPKFYYTRGSQVVGVTLFSQEHTHTVIAEKIDSNKNTLHYLVTQSPLPTANVDYKVKLPDHSKNDIKEHTVKLTFTGKTDHYSFTLNNLIPSTGATQSVALPQNIPLDVTAGDLHTQSGDTLRAVLTPENNTVIPSGNLTTQVIEYQAVNHKARLIGYLPLNWSNSRKTDPGSIADPQEMANAGYTHILIAFGIFSTDPACVANNSCILMAREGNQAIRMSSPDGRLNIPLDQYIQQLHQKNIKVLLSLGGASSIFGTTDFMRSFNAIAGSHASFDTVVTGYVAAIEDLMSRYGFDGVDIDVEHGLVPPRGASDLVSAGSVDTCVVHYRDGLNTSTGSVCAMSALIEKLKADSPDALISMAPQTLNVAANRSINDQILNYSALIANVKQYIDWVGIQVYNSGGMYGPDGGPTYDPNSDQLNTSVAMALDLAQRWVATDSAGRATGFVDNSAALLKPEQIVLGYPISDGVDSDGRPAANIAHVSAAVTCLNTGHSCDKIAPKMPFNQNASALGGVFGWTVNYDRANRDDFARRLNPVLNGNASFASRWNGGSSIVHLQTSYSYFPYQYKK